MKYSWKGHKDRNRHKNKIKRSEQARLVYVRHKLQHPQHVKLSPQGLLGRGSMQERGTTQDTWCVALVCRCACFFGGFICLFVLLVLLLFHSNTRFKWVARQNLNVFFPLQPFQKRYRPAIKFSREYTVHAVKQQSLSSLKMGIKQ